MQASVHFFQNSIETKKRLKRRIVESTSNFSLLKVEPITDNQRKTFEAFKSNKNLMLHGVAGTGKTFISLYLALELALIGKKDRPVVIVRSVVPTRDIGFLPGTLEEKIAVYEQPYQSLCSELFHVKNAYDELKKRGFLEFSTTSFLRGMTFNNTTILVDECQNLNFAELSTIITRCGDGCRIIFCGDFRQTDLDNRERVGLKHFCSIIKDMKEFDYVDFTENDIVRSSLVKSFIISQERYKEKNNLIL
jgi:phosphate starvation-inducible protein PhoH